jgi:nucleotide-binding universal stress UspA family protein
MTIARNATITVGVDGSPESMVAARWAAHEAELRHLSLLMVLAISEPLNHHSDYVFPQPIIDAVREVSGKRLDALAAAIRTEFPGLLVQTSLQFIDPRRALVTESHASQMTVVGTRGHGQLAEVLVGSVALYVSAHAHSPVAVVPPTTEVTGTGPVLAGIDERPDSLSAIGFAFDEAAVRGAGLVATLVFDDLAYRGFAKGATLIGPIADDEEHAVLSEQLAGWREKFPDVPVEKVVLRGRPAEELLRYMEVSGSTRPGVIVVGTRGRGGLAGLLLGSTSQRLITHADVPVIVVPPDDDH